MIKDIILGMNIFSLISQWIVFEKMGENGWSCLIPIYRDFIIVEHADKTHILCAAIIIGVILGLITRNLIVINIIIIAIFIVICYGYMCFAKKIGKPKWFGIGLILVPIVFFSILAFGKFENLNKDELGDEINNEQNNINNY